MTPQQINYSVINKAFSKQAEHYDEVDKSNSILRNWRQRVYAHCKAFLKQSSFILELNAGTGLDAHHFVQEGHRVYATDLSDGMVKKINQKIKDHSLLGKLTCKQCSYENLHLIEETNFDFIFSNFGGLNCVDELKKVTRHFPMLLKPGGLVTLVVMPPVSYWEWLWVFKGYTGKAFRRLNSEGASSHLEGEFFQTYYHSVHAIKKAMGKSFTLIKCESLGLVSPPPGSGLFPQQYPRLYTTLLSIENLLGSIFPFNRVGDHVIVTFRYRPNKVTQ